jgi:tagatose 1,6-diphosphate aldolase
MTPLRSLGKRWAMRRLADANGRFRMLAADQRPPIMALIARARGCPPADASFADITAVKRLLIEELAPYATATLADPNFAYPAAIDVLPPRGGLVLTLEDHRFQETPEGRRSASIPDWSVERIKRLGADGVKVLAWYRPDAGPEVFAHQQAYVRAVGRQCAALDIPFVLELLVYPFPGRPADAPASHASLVIESVRTFASPAFGVDLLKLESPVPAVLLPAENDVSGVARTQSLFDEVGRVAGAIPWVMLSAGATRTQFRRVLGFAYRAGASGFLAGRAIWAEAMAAFPDLDACRAALRDSGVSYMRGLAALTGRRADGWRVDYADLQGIDREGAFATAVGATEKDT